MTLCEVAWLHTVIVRKQGQERHSSHHKANRMFLICGLTLYIPPISVASCILTTPHLDAAVKHSESDLYFDSLGSMPCSRKYGCSRKVFKLSLFTPCLGWLSGKGTQFLPLKMKTSSSVISHWQCYYTQNALKCTTVCVALLHYYLLKLLSY